MTRYSVPDKAAINQILSELKIELDGTALGNISDQIIEIVRALNYDDDFHARNVGKKQVNKHIRSLNNLLDKVDYILGMEDDHLQRTVNTLLAPV